MIDDVLFICVTPVRNEAWILPFFLEQNSHWADLFIMLDQQSTDGTTEILENHPKVTLIKNESPEFNELYRAQVLWEAARKVEAKKKVIFALDADEYIPAAALNSKEWNTIAGLPCGTRIYTNWIQILPGYKSYYDLGKMIPFGYADDGLEIKGGQIHNDRVPLNENIKPYYSQSIINIHLGYVSINRNYKKHSWYIMWEFLNKEPSPFILNFTYRKFIGWSSKSVKPVDKGWLPDNIIARNLDIDKEDITWWDRDTVNWMKQYGVQKFRKLDIWKFDWNIISKQIDPEFEIINPQSGLDRCLIDYISYAKYHVNPLTRLINYTIKKCWK